MSIRFVAISKSYLTTQLFCFSPSSSAGPMFLGPNFGGNSVWDKCRVTANTYNSNSPMKKNILCLWEKLFYYTEQKQHKTELEVIVLNLNLLEMGKLSENSFAKICHQSSRKWAFLQLLTASATLLFRARAARLLISESTHTCTYNPENVREMMKSVGDLGGTLLHI